MRKAVRKSDRAKTKNDWTHLVKEIADKHYPPYVKKIKVGYGYYNIHLDFFHSVKRFHTKEAKRIWNGIDSYVLQS
jgi:hypothetical protein